jgi:hypothetical protein
MDRSGCYAPPVDQLSSAAERLIRQAISQRRRLSVLHCGLELIIEPYDLVQNGDMMIVRARQVRGQRDDAAADAQSVMRELSIADVEWAEPLDELF